MGAEKMSVSCGHCGKVTVVQSGYVLGNQLEHEPNCPIYAWWPMAKAPSCVAVCAPSQPSTGQRAADLLEGAAALMRDRDAVYQGADVICAAALASLFPDGLRLETALDHHRYHLFSLCMVKISRYVRNWQDGHLDSLVDLANHAAMLLAVDKEAEAKRKAVEAP